VRLSLNVINTTLGVPLGFIIYFAYQLTNSYGLAILIFAVIASIVLFPVNILTHRNSIRLLQIQPSLNEIKLRYAGDKERLNEEQYNLFQKEKYSPFIGLVPLFARLFLIMGILQVMYHPLQHLLRFDQGVIDALILAGRDLYGSISGPGEQLRVIEALQHPANLPAFQSALADFPGAANILQLAANTDLNFIGLNLGETPSLLNPSIALVIPLFSGLTALAFCLTQSAISPGALSQGKGTSRGLTIFTVALSLYFALTMPLGVGLYWTMGNLLGIATTLILNQLYSPKKLAGEALAHINAARKSTAQIQEERRQNKVLRIREKKDAADFRAAKKRLVFYALTGGQYKYYKNTIEYLLDNSDIVIHYLTNDPNDAIFQQNNKRLIPYYASQKKTISLMLKLDTDIMVTTVPDLQSYHMKRSIVRDDIEYIYMFHGLASTHMVAREKSFDYFDTLFCVGPHQVAESRRREELAGLPQRRLVKVGYGLYDQLIESYAAISHITNEKPRILIAPSWQADNIMDICIDNILEALKDKGYEIVVRPHPQYVRMFPERLESMKERYSDISEISFGLDFSDNQSIFLADVLITDWSNTAFEFSYCTLKPSVFINTPMKVLNPNYKQYGLEVKDITFRDEVGISIDVEGINNLYEAVDKLLSEKDDYRRQIERIVEEYLYHPGRNGEAGGRYIIMKLNNGRVLL